ncbi:MAG: glycosyltransferase family 4 protein, partial [Candidatus Eremiobacteraeota bacterium]|nr:glycosyltransferase family 4 protein [Candidatus Eremiobacteraeota bacterium]
MKRVGLDARLTDQLSVGMKTYVRELTERLPHVAPEFEYVPFSSGRNFGWDEQVRLPLAMRRAHLDVMHFLSIYVPLATPVQSVVTVHDLIHLRFPQYFKKKVRPYYQTVVRLACARARRVITDDERTVEDLERYLGVSRAKVRVVPLGVDDRFTGTIVPYVAPRSYVLYVGNHREHKNLATLFAAWSSLPRELEIDLYLTGPDDFDGELQRRSTSTRRAVALGDVPVPALAQYYAGARALVQPALREGFGLPTLEAMAAGCAVVASEDAIPRVLKTAALTFASGDAGQLSATLQAVITDEGLRERFVRDGRAIAARLGWDRCARATADVYREVLE